jgi:hypothetical protein
MNPLYATIEEFAADGYTHIECHCPRCRAIRLRPISWLPRISLGLTISQLSARLRCFECGGQVHSVKPRRVEGVLGGSRWGEGVMVDSLRALQRSNSRRGKGALNYG